MESTPLIRNRSFLQLWTGQAFSFAGDMISLVAVIVLVVNLTGSASAVGGVLLARLLPTLASPIMGVLADRLDRRRVLVVSDLARAGLMLGIIFAESILLLYVLVFLVGLAKTIFNPTIRAAFPSVVGAGDLTRANGIISGTFSASIAVGPAIGGLLVASVGVDAAFLVDAVTYLISAAFLSRLHLPAPERADSSSFTAELQQGLGYLATARIPLAIVGGALLLQLTQESTVPGQVFLARDTFTAGDTGYGVLVATWGAGMVIGSGLIAVLGDRIRLLPFYFSSIFVCAIAFVVAGSAPVFLLALAGIVLGGVSNGIDNVTTDTILQKQVPEQLLGRVFSVRFMGLSLGELIAYPAGGLLVESTGPRVTFISMGVATAVAGVLIALLVALPLVGRKADYS